MTNRILYPLLGLCVGFAGATTMRALTSSSQPRIIPNVTQVQEGFIAPSKLEIELQDLDHNGEKETIMKIAGEDYLLRDVNGTPTLSKYKIELSVE